MLRRQLSAQAGVHRRRERVAALIECGAGWKFHAFAAVTAGRSIAD
jgi:hypothetical protein